MGRIRWGRSVAIAATVLFIGFTVIEVIVVVAGMVRSGDLGADLRVYQGIAGRWLETGVLYSPDQFAGPYTNTDAWLAGGVLNLYPPPTVLLFVPFLYVPAIVWWVIPYGIVVAGIIYWRPAWWSWPVLAAALVPLPFSSGVGSGNTSNWAIAALMAATRWPAAAVLLALKPSVFPLALIFVRSRAWWIAAAAIGLLCLAFLPYWPDWWRAAQNLEGNALLYSVPGLPLLLFPLLVRLATTRMPDRSLATPRSASFGA